MLAGPPRYRHITFYKSIAWYWNVSILFKHICSIVWYLSIFAGLILLKCTTGILMMMGKYSIHEKWKIYFQQAKCIRYHTLQMTFIYAEVILQKVPRHVTTALYLQGRIPRLLSIDNIFGRLLVRLHAPLYAALRRHAVLSIYAALIFFIYYIFA